MASPQQLEKVQPAFAGRRAKPGEVVIADLRAGPVRGLVAGPGVVDRDPGRLRQPSTKHVAGFIEEALLAMNEQAHDLPRGDRQTDGPQLRHQARHRDLPLMVLGQYKAAQLRPEMAIDPARQRRHNQLSVRCQPALPAIADAAGPQHQVLNDEIRVALEATTARKLLITLTFMADGHFAHLRRHWAKYWLSTLPEDIPFDRLVALAKLRWRIERDYQELK